MDYDELVSLANTEVQSSDGHVIGDLVAVHVDAGTSDPLFVEITSPEHAGHLIVPITDASFDGGGITVSYPAHTIAGKTLYIAGLDERIRAVEARANNKALEGAFDASLRKLLWATVAAAFGILAFAWAANPPDAPPATADLTNSRLNGAALRDVDLAHATLDGADLSGADLVGADLTGTSIKDVIWRNTICPDGSNSDTVGGSCAGHLAPRTR